MSPAHKAGEVLVDPAPFRAWADAELAILETTSDAPTVRFVSELGWLTDGTSEDAAVRRLHRWRNESLTLPWLDVYEALSFAGAAWWDIYPGHEVEAPTYTGAPRGKPMGKYRLLSDDQVRAAHKLYVDRQLSLRALGALLYERFGYASAKSCSMGLHTAFIGLGLPRRDRIEATVLASLKHGKSRRAERSTPESLAHRRALRKDRQPQCAGVKASYPDKGRPCQRPALAGSKFCIGHDPERAEQREAILRDARARAGANA